MKNKAAQSLGRLGGLKKSKAKASASRKNGKLGGRKPFIHRCSASPILGAFAPACHKLGDVVLTLSWPEVTCPRCLELKL